VAIFLKWDFGELKFILSPLETAGQIVFRAAIVARLVGFQHHSKTRMRVLGKRQVRNSSTACLNTSS
jgi:hypothetical protein